MRFKFCWENPERLSCYNQVELLDGIRLYLAPHRGELGNLDRCGCGEKHSIEKSGCRGICEGYK